MGESLFETVVGKSAGDIQSIAGASLSLQTGPLVVASPLTGSADTLRQSRVRWLVVRMSHRARGFLAQPSQHFMRLVSILRYFTALAETLPPDLLLLILEPLLTPIYRCMSAFSAGYYATLGDVQTLEQMLELTPAQRLEFLAQLAQTCMDGLNNKMKDAGKSAELAQALNKVRKAVERKRSDRVQQKRIQKITDPEAAAKRQRTKNKLKRASKKRKIDELITTTKGGRGSKKARNLSET